MYTQIVGGRNDVIDKEIVLLQTSVGYHYRLCEHVVQSMDTIKCECGK